MRYHLEQFKELWVNFKCSNPVTFWLFHSSSLLGHTTRTLLIVLGVFLFEFLAFLVVDWFIVMAVPIILG